MIIVSDMKMWILKKNFVTLFSPSHIYIKVHVCEKNIRLKKKYNK